MKNKLYNQSVFFISLLIAFFMIIGGFIFRDVLNEISERIMTTISVYFGWLYIVSVIFFIVFLIFLVCSRWGDIKLGNDADIPEYNIWHWFAMVFCGATGIGLVFWSIAEPLSHYVNSPTGIEPLTQEAMDFSFRTCYLHWGITQFSCFAIVGLGLAFFQFKKGKTALISNLLEPILGEKAAKGVVGKIIDVFSVVVTFAGVSTSLGLGVSQMCGGLNHLFNISSNRLLWGMVITIITVIFIFSALSGVNKGIKILSSINTILAIVLLMLAFIFGPKLIILNNLVASTGQHINYLFSDLSMTSSYYDNAWVMNWRVFYYAWFIAWCPFVGMFFARISKGRTVREFIVGTVIAPTIFTIIWLSVFGTIAFESTKNFSIEYIREIVNQPETAVFVVLQNNPIYKIMALLIILLLGVFFITSADSATYSLGMMSSNGSMNPPKLKKIIWGIVEALLAYLLLSAGSIKPLQTISIACSFPFVIIMLIIMMSLLIEFKKNINNKSLDE